MRRTLQVPVMRVWKVNVGCSSAHLTKEEFTIQNPESRMGSVGQDGESRFKASDFNMRQ